MNKLRRHVLSSFLFGGGELLETRSSERGGLRERGLNREGVY